MKQNSEQKSVFHVNASASQEVIKLELVDHTANVLDDNRISDTAHYHLKLKLGTFHKKELFKPL